VTADQLLPTATVAWVFRVVPASIANWRTRRRLTPDETASQGAMLFSIPTLEAFVSGAAVNCDADYPPPTFMQLFDHQETLLTCREAATQLSIAPSSLTERVRAGTMPALRFAKKTLRFSAGHIARMMIESQDVVELGTAAQILGITTETLTPLVGNQLERQTAGRRVYVTRESLLVYLADRLADSGVPPLVWWHDRLLDPKPLVTMVQAKRRLRYDWDKLGEIMAEGRLPFICTPGNFRLIPEHYVAALEEARLPLTPVQLSELFAVSKETAAYWLETRAFCRVQHDRSNLFCPRKGCVLAYVSEHTNAKIEPERWWRVRRSDANEALRIDEAAAMIDGSSREEILWAIQAGVLRAIILPANREGEIDALVSRWDVHRIAYSLGSPIRGN